MFDGHGAYSPSHPPERSCDTQLHQWSSCTLGLCPSPAGDRAPCSPLLSTARWGPGVRLRGQGAGTRDEAARVQQTRGESGEPSLQHVSAAPVGLDTPNRAAHGLVPPHRCEWSSYSPSSGVDVWQIVEGDDTSVAERISDAFVRSAALFFFFSYATSSPIAATLSAAWTTNSVRFSGVVAPATAQPALPLSC